MLKLLLGIGIIALPGLGFCQSSVRSIGGGSIANQPMAQQVKKTKVSFKNTAPFPVVVAIRFQKDNRWITKGWIPIMSRTTNQAATIEGDTFYYFAEGGSGSEKRIWTGDERFPTSNAGFEYTSNCNNCNSSEGFKRLSISSPGGSHTVTLTYTPSTPQWQPPQQDNSYPSSGQTQFNPGMNAVLD